MLNKKWELEEDGYGGWEIYDEDGNYVAHFMNLEVAQYIVDLHNFIIRNKHAIE
jgi:hypothetical protein